jgi:lipoprotein-releasing system permease protein
MSFPRPFARHEFAIAARYLKARRADGGVSVMTWISLVGIALAVAALIITLAVRSGFRTEFVDTILGSGAHVTAFATVDASRGGAGRSFVLDQDVITRLEAVPGVVRTAPLVRGQVMASIPGSTMGVEILGIRPADVLRLPGLAPATQMRAGAMSDLPSGIAIGSEIARGLGVQAGESIKLISPDGVKTPFGTSPRISVYKVAHVFTAGRYDIDKFRVYMPLEEAQIYFNKEGVIDEIEIILDDPEAVEDYRAALEEALGPMYWTWTWTQASSAFLGALEMEDNVMFVLMSVLVLIAAMNIVSGLVMLVKNKGRDIGILRTIGLTEGAIMRVFFLCGALVGLVGTLLGIVLGCTFAIWFETLMGWISGGGWDASVRGIYRLPARLEFADVASAAALSLSLSFLITIFPARRAARLNPVEALRYE